METGLLVETLTEAPPAGLSDLKRAQTRASYRTFVLPVLKATVRPRPTDEALCIEKRKLRRGVNQKAKNYQRNRLCSPCAKNVIVCVKKNFDFFGDAQGS